MRFKLLMLAILMFSTGFIACNANSIDPKDESRHLAELAESLEVEFPASTQILSLKENDRAGEAASFYVIYSPEPVTFNVLQSSKIEVEVAIEVLEIDVNTKPFGKVKDKWAYCYEGKMKIGSWRVYQTHFETGSYLIVEQFFF